MYTLNYNLLAKLIELSCAGDIRLEFPSIQVLETHQPDKSVNFSGVTPDCLPPDKYTHPHSLHGQSSGYREGHGTPYCCGSGTQSEASSYQLEALS